MDVRIRTRSAAYDTAQREAAVAGEWRLTVAEAGNAVCASPTDFLHWASILRTGTARSTNTTARLRKRHVSGPWPD